MIVNKFNIVQQDAIGAGLGRQLVFLMSRAIEKQTFLVGNIAIAELSFRFVAPLVKSSSVFIFSRFYGDGDLRGDSNSSIMVWCTMKKWLQYFIHHVIGVITKSVAWKSWSTSNYFRGRSHSLRKTPKKILTFIAHHVRSAESDERNVNSFKGKSFCGVASSRWSSAFNFAMQK